MALMPCPECEKEVSDKAPTCPNCGTPIANREADKETGVTLTTIQGTSKKFKRLILISALLFWGGIFVQMGGGGKQ